MTISLNDDRLHDLMIGRTEEFKTAHTEHEYMVIRDSDFSTSATFKHRYSDGALLCVERALQALRST